MKTILASVDFSDVAPSVVKAAAELARFSGARLCLLHVASPEPDFVGYGPGPQTVRDAAARVYREKHRRLQTMESRLRKRKVDARALVVQGPTVEKILREARRLHAGMIVMGSHGHGALHRVLVGSVAEGVLRKAPCPVLVVPRRKR